MSDQAFYSGLQSKLETLRSDGLFKPERWLTGGGEDSRTERGEAPTGAEA